VAKACILSVSGPVLTPGEADLFKAQNPWGVILMGRSCVSRDQVRRLVADIWDSTGRETLIFIDQEGGRVARLKAPEWPLFPRGADYAAIYEKDPELGREACWLGHRLIASELASLSIHADCAPVVDLPVPGRMTSLATGRLEQSRSRRRTLPRPLCGSARWRCCERDQAHSRAWPVHGGQPSGAAARDRWGQRAVERLRCLLPRRRCPDGDDSAHRLRGLRSWARRRQCRTT
jgi:hypothetical protein